ncbi:unnamed protein product [Owenia fusiformis]|uniref:Uncharacterized protein n=1 Tax=Owenia fusiformis TaxID=6347 RepID=A0A8J1XS79_OWEFU|nr:unnamed protein product [Owenia fusiformis]
MQEICRKRTTRTGTHYKLPDGIKNEVRRHTEAILRMASHYTGRDTNKEYLELGLNVKKMHALFVEECKQFNKTTVNKRMYREIFKENYNIAFYKPKKINANYVLILMKAVKILGQGMRN